MKKLAAIILAAFFAAFFLNLAYQLGKFHQSQSILQSNEK